MQFPLSFIYFVCVYPGCKTLREGRKSLFQYLVETFEITRTNVIQDRVTADQRYNGARYSDA